MTVLLIVLFIFACIGIGVGLSYIPISYNRGVWHLPGMKLPFKIPYRYTLLESSEKNKRWLEIHVGNTKLCGNLTVGMYDTGLFDYRYLEFNGIGESYKVLPGRGTNLLEVKKAIEYMNEVKSPLKISFSTTMLNEVNKLLGKINNLKFIERVESEKT